MQVKCVRQLEPLQPLATRWDQLAGDCPFREWNWLTTWWQHYGNMHAGVPMDHGTNLQRELYVLLVYADPSQRSPSGSCGEMNGLKTAMSDRVNKQDVVAILPCYLERTITRGRVLRLLGDGEVCSDHLSLLVESNRTDVSQILSALVAFLDRNADDWDLLEFVGVEADDPMLAKLFAMMGQQDFQVCNRPGLKRWSVSLPESWELYLAQLSKSHRKQLRRLQRRVLDTDRAVWHLAEADDDLAKGWDCLVDLHQRRRHSLGQPGCFTSVRFARFHRHVAGLLLAAGKLKLSWLELDGEPVAAEYMLAGVSASYAYQSGLSPERIEESPGQLSLMCSIQQAIGSEHRQFDFLRGDEPYKAHWRAKPHETCHVQVVPSRVGARWRYQSWSHIRQAGLWMRDLVTSGSVEAGTQRA